MSVPVLMASDDIKVIASHFDHVDLRNAVIPLVMPLASCDTDTETDGIT